MRKLLIAIQKKDLPRTIKLTPYAKSIVDYVKEGKVYTRRQIAEDLGYLHSSVITKINELIDHELLKECDTIKCTYTNRRVRGIVKA
jgi:Mn-dependent DtxR family transcriptional regulator